MQGSCVDIKPFLLHAGQKAYLKTSQELVPGVMEIASPKMLSLLW